MLYSKYTKRLPLFFSLLQRRTGKSPGYCGNYARHRKSQTFSCRRSDKMRAKMSPRSFGPPCAPYVCFCLTLLVRLFPLCTIPLPSTTKPAAHKRHHVRHHHMVAVYRHALLLTNAALYLLEVEMQPPHVQQHQQQHQQQQQQPKDPGNAGDETKALTSRRSLQDRANAQTTDSGAALPPFMEAVSESREFREEGTLELAGTGRGVPAGAAGGGGGGGGGMEKAKIKSIKMMDRLQPSQLLHVSLPFKEVRS